MMNNTARKPDRIMFKIGVALLITACLLWLSLIVIPFMPLSGSAKTGLATSALIAGEIAFWLGAALTGKEFMQRYKKHLNPKNWKVNKK